MIMVEKVLTFWGAEWAEWSCEKRKPTLLILASILSCKNEPGV